MEPMDHSTGVFWLISLFCSKSFFTAYFFNNASKRMTWTLPEMNYTISRSPLSCTTLLELRLFYCLSDRAFNKLFAIAFSGISCYRISSIELVVLNCYEAVMNSLRNSQKKSYGGIFLYRMIQV